MADPIETAHGETVQVGPTELPGLNGLVTLLVSVVVIAALYLAREVLIPITLAVLLSFLLAPLVGLLRRVHLGRVPSVLIAAALGVVMVIGVGGLIGSQIASLASNIPEYTSTFEHKVAAVQTYAGSRVARLLNGLKTVTPPAPAKPVATPHTEKTATPAAPKPIPVEVEQPPLSAVALAESVLTPLISPLATTGIVFVVAIFVQLQQEDLRDRFIRLAGSGDLHRTTGVMDDAAHRLSRYFIAQLSVNTMFGIVIGFGLTLIGVPSAILWGVMAMILRFVPYIGSPMAAVLPIALAAAVDPGWSMVIWTAALFLGVELLTGQVIEPILYGHSTGLSPVAVIISAIFWTWIWGPIGLILSMPLTLCLVVLGRHVKRLEFLDILLGDRPALTPIESFYQRMLAGDSDEAQEQAEIILKESTLTAYYDEVALPGLQLASSDALQGVLRPEQVTRLGATVESLVHELGDHPDAELVPHKRGALLGYFGTTHDIEHPDEELMPPPGWDAEAPILVAAGRGPLDATAAIILAQLLTKHGLKARIVPNIAVSRARIGFLSLDGVAMVCVPHLSLAGAPAHLRNVVRRLRQRLPNHPILVGLWPTNDSVLADERLRAALGADFYVSSFHDAVRICLDTARRAGEPKPRAAAA